MSAMSTVVESADENQTTVKTLRISHSRAVMPRRGSGGSANELAVMESSLVGSDVSVPSVSMSTWMTAAAAKKTATSDNDSTAAGGKTRHGTALSHPMLRALVLQLYMCSAFLLARDEMAFVEKKRSVVEHGHGETRAFVGLVSV
jgi:hypothetical protein